MSVYPWMKRHKRYLSFRYLFPEVAAAGIIFCRALLRIKWFFTHSVDEIVDDLWALMLLPFEVIGKLGRWTGLVVYEFLKDLATGVQLALRWLGGVPVWTGAALAGVFGVILTILLFLLPALQTRPVPAAIGSDRIPQTLISEPPSADHDELTSEPRESQFDPFARPEVEPPTDVIQVLPIAEDDLFADTRQADIDSFVTRLSMPFGWEQGRRINVVSAKSKPPSHERRLAFNASLMNDGWDPPRRDRQSSEFEFSPYVSRLNPRQTQRTPDWISPADFIEPMNPVVGNRQPSIVVEKQTPQTSLSGRPFHYTLVVSNRGEETLPSVRVRERTSAIERVTNVHPSANVVGDALVWDITDLHPGEQRRLQVELHPDEPVTLAQNTTVQVTTGIAAVSEVRQPEPEPALVKPEPEPPGSILPDFDPEPTPPAPPESEQANDEPVREMLPWDEPPLEEVAPQQEPPLYADDFPDISPPPEDDPVDHDAIPVKSSPVQPPTDALTFEMESPSAIFAGGHVPTIFTLRNRGDADLADVVLKVKLSDELTHQHGQSLVLRLDRLAAGETYRTRLTTSAVQTGTATITSRLMAEGSLSQKRQRDVQIATDRRPSNDVVIRLPRRCPPPPCHVQPRF